MIIVFAFYISILPEDRPSLIRGIDLALSYPNWNNWDSYDSYVKNLLRITNFSNLTHPTKLNYSFKQRQTQSIYEFLDREKLKQYPLSVHLPLITQ